MLIKLKSLISPPSRLNPFFHLKATVSPVVHSVVSLQVAQNEMDIQIAFSAMNQFDEVLQETRKLFDSPPTLIPATQKPSTSPDQKDLP